MNYLLIGRTNAGKSSIFNLLTDRKNNIVHKEEGTTRDWHKELIKETDSYIFDTPGILVNIDNKKFSNSIFDEILKLKIDYFIYVIEYKNGFNQIDNFNINQLRKYDKKIILVINKFDNYTNDPSAEFTNYGIPLVYYVSCSHNHGIDNLKLIFNKNNLKYKINQINELSIAIFGKPNSGKSTLLNSLVGYNRSQTSTVAGTTSDLVTDSISYKNHKFKFIDTAGIGRKAKIDNKSINYYAIKKSFESIATVDFSILLIDSNEGIDKQDKRIVKLVSDKSKGILVVFNKIDLIENKEEYQSNMLSEVTYSLNEVKNIKIFFISALQNKNILKLLDYILDNHFLINYKIPTSKLNKWLVKTVKQNQHPLIVGKVVNFKYAVQVKQKPVTIKIFCSYSNRLKSNYKKYLINNFNYNFKILNQKTKFIFSSSKNPYI